MDAYNTSGELEKFIVQCGQSDKLLYAFYASAIFSGNIYIKYHRCPYVRPSIHSFAYETGPEVIKLFSYSTQLSMKF